MRQETEWRYHNSEFGRRPFMLSVMRYGTRWTGIPSPLFFSLVQFLGYLGCLVALHRLTCFVWPGQRIPPLTLLPFVLIFPSVFLFTAHAHTYNDLYQYIAITLLMLFAISHRPFPALLMGFLACIIRESSLFFLPVLMYLLSRYAYWSPWKAVATVAVTACLSVLFLYLYLPEEVVDATVAFSHKQRFGAWRENFGTLSDASETLVLTVIILVPFAAVAWRFRSQIGNNALHKDLVYCSLFVALVNTPIVYAAALAREARLLVLPLLPLLPVVCPILLQCWKRGDVASQKISLLQGVGALLLGLAVALIYQPSVGGTGYFYRAYVFVWVAGWSPLLLRLVTNRLEQVDVSPTR